MLKKRKFQHPVHQNSSNAHTSHVSRVENHKLHFQRYLAPNESVECLSSSWLVCISNAVLINSRFFSRNVCRHVFRCLLSAFRVFTSHDLLELRFKKESTMYRKLNKDSLMRSNSICPTPEAILLDLVKTNDTDNIKRLVAAKPDLLEFIYTPEFNKPILLIALTEDDVDCTTIETLIDLGADLYYSSEIDEEWQAIHFAAYRTNVEILQGVVDRLNDPGDVNSLAKGNNALHVLIKHGRNDLTREFTKCVAFLIKSGIDVNCSDPNGVSPILWAAKKSQKNTIKAILENSLVPVDLDTHQSRKKTARDIIMSENLYDGVLPSKIEPTELTETQILFEYIKSQNEKAFVAFKKGDIYDLVDATDSSATLLQMACEKGLKTVVKHLVDKGADPNKTSEKNRKTPLEIVAENGFYNVFDVLVNNPKTYVAKDVLTTLLKYIDNEHFPGVDHRKCYQMLVDALKQHKITLDVNASDATRNTPLHYAVRYADAEKVEDLLCLGASLGAKNRYGEMPIQDIELMKLTFYLLKTSNMASLKVSRL